MRGNGGRMKHLPGYQMDWAMSERRRDIAGLLLTRRQLLRERVYRVAGLCVVGVMVVLSVGGVR